MKRYNEIALAYYSYELNYLQSYHANCSIKLITLYLHLLKIKKNIAMMFNIQYINPNDFISLKPNQILYLITIIVKSCRINKEFLAKFALPFDRIICSHNTGMLHTHCDKLLQCKGNFLNIMVLLQKIFIQKSLFFNQCIFLHRFQILSPFWVNGCRKPWLSGETICNTTINNRMNAFILLLPQLTFLGQHAILS